MAEIQDILSSKAPVRRSPKLPAPPGDRYWLHILLFLVTLISTAHVGGLWANRSLIYSLEGPLAFIEDGLRFALPLMLFLTVHEFGHYFAARHHEVRVSLPYYIPLPLFGIGTLGAVIRIREQVPSMRTLFDIGVAGPVAGFVAALAILVATLATLPPPDYLLDLEGHIALKRHITSTGGFPDQMPEPVGTDQAVTIVVGQTLLYWAMTAVVPDAPP
ncbi:MAG: site-2 protease family protein, partial [Rhodothermia bacterium]|nr:site-2 protease family protein [Rhodothermia bacterium]